MILKEIIESITEENFLNRKESGELTILNFNLPSELYTLELTGWVETTWGSIGFINQWGESDEKKYIREVGFYVKEAKILKGNESTDLNISRQDVEKLNKELLNIIEIWEIEN